MKKNALMIGSFSLLAIFSVSLYQTSRGDGRSLTVDEMRSTCGSSSGGCVLSAPLSDCNVADDPCNACIDSQSIITVQTAVSTKVKNYLGADRKICTVPTTPNTKVCDPGIVTCWTERSCDPGAIQTDKSCNANPTGDCLTPDPPTDNTWYCRKYSRGAPTGINKTKNDDDCV